MNKALTCEDGMYVESGKCHVCNPKFANSLTCTADGPVKCISNKKATRIVIDGKCATCVETYG